MRFLRARLHKIEGEYKFKLVYAKRDGWDNTCQQVTEKEPFGVHFDVAKTPDRRHFQLSAVKKQDGSITNTIEEAFQELLGFHFPTDDHRDTPHQDNIHRSCRDPPSTPDDLPFSLAEVEAAVKNINSKKAPGPDGLFGDVVKEAFHSNKTYFHSFFNECLAKGYFPRRWRIANLVLFNKIRTQRPLDPFACWMQWVKFWIN
ncbi:hypothetical protein AVEN_114630-1 [Araneus ventricosus]|uniref:Retrovirus-related Pol polyprotein from type-1 retrotransposable element R1 n=1 Tax=Araneus ventricosus TaxID=182803 RepID=A0A4Y2GAY6_ARAVE|nr:hypothetical protein AVEN_114630-1 [Araneus ventricosus]